MSDPQRPRIQISLSFTNITNKSRFHQQCTHTNNRTTVCNPMLSCKYFSDSKLVFIAPPALATCTAFRLAVFSCTVFLSLGSFELGSDCSRAYKFYMWYVTQYKSLRLYEEGSPGLENTVAPPKAPSKILIGVRTKRGPISTSDVSGGPLGLSGSFSIIWKLRNQIFPSRMEKVMT